MLKSIQGIISKIKHSNSSIFEPGYFYSFVYRFGYKNDKKTIGWDSEPLIICIGSFKNNPNFFLGLNLHYIDDTKLFLDNLDSFSGGLITKDGINKIILTRDILTRIYKPSLKALRVYNKKNVFDCYRINNKYIEEVLKHQLGDYYLSSVKHNEFNNQFKRATEV